MAGAFLFVFSLAMERLPDDDGIGIERPLISVSMEGGAEKVVMSSPSSEKLSYSLFAGLFLCCFEDVFPAISYGRLAGIESVERVDILLS